MRSLAADGRCAGRVDRVHWVRERRSTGALRPRVHRPERRAVLPDGELALTASRPSTASRSTSTSPCRRPGDGPFPTIVMMHGWGGSKTDFESTSPGRPLQQQLLRPPATRSSTTRPAASATPAAAGRAATLGALRQGYIRLADTRYEARDTQYLLGLLADEGITKPHAIGVTGISYGGGQSIELAILSDQIRQARRQARPVAQPRRHAAVDRRRLPALALVGPGRRAASQRPLPRHPGRARSSRA